MDKWKEHYLQYGSFVFKFLYRQLSNDYAFKHKQQYNMW